MEVKCPVTLNRHLNYSTPAYIWKKTKALFTEKYTS